MLLTFAVHPFVHAHHWWDFSPLGMATRSLCWWDFLHSKVTTMSIHSYIPLMGFSPRRWPQEPADRIFSLESGYDIHPSTRLTDGISPTQAKTWFLCFWYFSTRRIVPVHSVYRIFSTQKYQCRLTYRLFLVVLRELKLSVVGLLALTQSPHFAQGFSSLKAPVWCFTDGIFPTRSTYASL